MATELASELPDLLRNRVDGGVSWDVPVVVDPLAGPDREAPEILDACRDRREQEGRDLAICLTDLPVYRDGRLVVAGVSAKRGGRPLAASLGEVARLRPRTRELALQLAHELYTRTKETGPDHPQGRGPRSAEDVGPFRSVDPPDADMKALGVDALRRAG
jgi:hypothetical protein